MHQQIMAIRHATCYVGENICIPVELKSVGNTRIYEVINQYQIIAKHNQLCRVFGKEEFPNFVNGVFQRANYYGDADSAGCKWIQYLISTPPPCILKEDHQWDNYVRCIYGKNQTVYLEFA